MRSHGVATVQEAIASLGGIKTHIETPSYDFGDVGLCSSIIDSPSSVELGIHI